jgi:parvulin-like peptidyl-prolyl isomerase
MFRRIVILSLMFSSLCAGACKEEPEAAPQARKESLAAVVNGVPIYMLEFQSAVQHAEKVFAQRRGPLSGKEKTEFAELILTKMIDDELLVQYAGTVGIQLNQEEVESELENIKHSGGGNAAFIRFLQDKGLSQDRVRANLRRNMIVKRLVQQIRSGEVISDAEIAEYHREHQDDFRTPGTVELAHILIKRGEGGQDAVERASKIRKEIKAGLAFEKAAQKYSQDPATRGRGGALGALNRGEMHPDLETAAFSVKVGSVSAPVESPQGIHLLKVIRRTSGDPLPLTQIQSQVREKILNSRTEQKVKELLERLNLEGQIERKALP